MRAIERLESWIDSLGNSIKCSIIAGDLNLPYVDWKGIASRGQPFINRLVLENGYGQVVKRPTRGHALLDVYLVRPESLLASCSIEQDISDHCGILLEAEWEEKYCRPQAERLVQVYKKANCFRPTYLPKLISVA
jgi:hypothetical protein